MTLRFKRNERGTYEGCTKAFNQTTGKHEPIFEIVASGKSWILVESHTETGTFRTLKQAERAAQDIEDKRPQYKTDEDEGLAHATYKPGQTISTFISAERIGGRLYVSEDGKAIISETRYPDGTITTERREYGN